MPRREDPIRVHFTAMEGNKCTCNYCGSTLTYRVETLRVHKLRCPDFPRPSSTSASENESASTPTRGIANPLENINFFNLQTREACDLQYVRMLVRTNIAFRLSEDNQMIRFTNMLTNGRYQPPTRRRIPDLISQLFDLEWAKLNNEVKNQYGGLDVCHSRKCFCFHICHLFQLELNGSPQPRFWNCGRLPAGLP